MKLSPAEGAPRQQRVWLGFDQAGLDREYNARASVPDFDAEMRRYRDLSAAARGALAHAADLVFDPASGCALDWFVGAPGGPVLLWIHGGYWRALSKSDNSCVAPGLVAAGVHVAVMDYSLAPAATLDGIVAQARAAAAWVHGAAAERGADPGRVFVGGSSAGGHLAAMLLVEPSAPIAGGVCVSGLYELEPIRRSHVNAWLGLDEDAVGRLSPRRRVPAGAAGRLLAAYGALETSEFRRQSEDFAAAWARAGHAAVALAVQRRHHFDIVLALGEAGDPLCRAACDFMEPR